jgi:hypothetical protein
VPVPLLPAKGFDVDLAALEARITPRTRILLLNSPHNPTGGVIAPATLAAIAELAKRHDFTVISDEIYAGMVYDGESPSIATLPGMAERTVVVDGFSKTYAMTGWRLGFGIMPEALARHMANLMNNSNSCTATFVQKAGEAALLGPQDEVASMVQEFRVRRDHVVQWLNAIPGVCCGNPAGAFYVFPNIVVPGMTSEELANRLLDEAGVVTLPGSAFGEGGEGYLRLSYANSLAQLREGCRIASARTWRPCAGGERAAPTEARATMIGRGRDLGSRPRLRMSGASWARAAPSRTRRRAWDPRAQCVAAACSRRRHDVCRGTCAPHPDSHAPPRGPTCASRDCVPRSSSPSPSVPCSSHPPCMPHPTCACPRSSLAPAATGTATVCSARAMTNGSRSSTAERRPRTWRRTS